jgi:hypothetical protein
MKTEKLGKPPALVAFPGRLQITDANGEPCPGAQLHIAGAKREVMSLYADAEHTIPLPNPVVADAEGMLPVIYLDSSSFDCMASSDNRILWSYFDCKGFAWGNAAAALPHFSRRTPVIKAHDIAGTVTSLGFDRGRDLFTLNLADPLGAPLAELQLTATAAQDLRRLLGTLIDEPLLGGSMFSLPTRSEKPN